MKKTAKMIATEERLGQSLETLIPKLYREHGTLEGVAQSLGVNANTLYYWLARMGLKIERILVR